MARGLATRSRWRRLRSAHSRHTFSGITPAFMSNPKILQPTQKPARDSKAAATMIKPSTAHVAVWSPKPNHRTTAAVENAVPIAWAKRFGGPGTGLGGPSLGATTRVASWPSGLRLGPVSTLAQNPYAIGASSQGSSKATAATHMTRTAKATTRRGKLVYRVGEAEQPLGTAFHGRNPT